jgi:hypothetical protein
LENTAAGNAKQAGQGISRNNLDRVANGHLSLRKTGC